MTSALRLATLCLAAGAALFLYGTDPAKAQNCTASIDNLAFGPIDTLSGNDIDGSGNITIACPPAGGSTVCATIGAGSGGSASDGTRLLSTGAGSTLRYQLYQDSARSVPWATNSVVRIVVPSGAGSVTLPLYARIFGNQSAAPVGDYVSTFAGAQTGFFYGGISLGCALILLGSVTRPSFQVRAQIAGNCLVEADDLDFGSRGLLNAALSAASRLRVRCTPGAPYSIALGGGSGAAGLPRRMTRATGPGSVQYGLFQDDARTVPWSQSATVTGLGDGLTRTIPVYGLVPAQPTPPAGRYTDVVVVTVTH